jgi:hypothetical protein
MTHAFVRSIEEFVAAEDLDLIAFQKNQRKDEVTQKRIRKFKKNEGLLYVGKAQEKARVMRTERHCCSRTGATYPWIVESTAMVNHYYFYCVDEDFGPFFLKFCSYFPYNGKLCINGHEYLKRQLAKRGVAFEELDNGVKSCANPKLLQRLADELTAEKIDRLLRKWLRRLPHPFPARDRAAGYRYQLSILQAEFSLTQVLDQPVMGRIFFEEVIRENLDIGRPSQVSLVFDRKITGRTPGRFRTRVITDGVVPSLHLPSSTSSTTDWISPLAPAPRWPTHSSPTSRGVRPKHCARSVWPGSSMRWKRCASGSAFASSPKMAPITSWTCGSRPGVGPQKEDNHATHARP